MVLETFDTFKLLFPVGTKFKPVHYTEHNFIDEVYTIESHGDYYVNSRGNINNTGRGMLYLNNGGMCLWARKQLVEYTKEQLLEEAKRRYPVGTQFYPINAGMGLCDMEVIQNYSIRLRGNDVDNGSGLGLIYDSNTFGWAPIISTPVSSVSSTEFKPVIIKRTLPKINFNF